MERFVDFNYLYDEYVALDLVGRFNSLKLWFSEIPYRDMLWRKTELCLDGYLSAWLPFIGKFQATLIRDKIYALAGLIQEESRIKVDYKTKARTREYVKSDGQVFTEATIRMIAESEFTALAYSAGEKSPDLNLPSWCPDWTRNYNQVPFLGLGYSAYIPGEATNNEFRWLREDVNDAGSENLRSSSDNKVLGVRGFVVDTIDFLESTPDVPADQGGHTSATRSVGPERRRLTLEACKRWEDHVLSQKADSYANGCGCLEAFWRTLIADRVRGGSNMAERERRFKEAAPSTLRSNFDAWMGRPGPEVRSMTDSERSAHPIYLKATRREGWGG